MAGETKRTYATKELDAETNQEEKKLASEQFKEKALKGSPEHFQNVCVESQTVTSNTKFVEKEKDNTQQREAVIRPQQAGKIDFKSLQNRSNLASDRTWPNGKVSPHSPSGKSRMRDKGKKSGKTERANPQQLCRRSTSNPRSTLTIGIAYPQQKVSSPKKLEASRGPVSGSYRFHVPNIPEREAELQQEDFNLNRCFQEGPNLISPSYTSQPVGSAAGGSSHQHSASTALQQQPGALETNNTQPTNQMLFPDFQLSGADMWQSPDRAFSNVSFGVPSQKSSSVAELNKPNGFVPLPFQYGYPLLDNADSFPCDQNPQPQDLIEASLGPNQVTQNSFSFQSSGEEHEVVQSNTKLSYERSEDRQYSLHPKPPQYVQTPHTIASSLHCTRSIGDGVSNGDSKETNNQQPDKKKSALSDKSDNFGPVDTRDIGATSGSKRGCHSKSSTSSQRILIQGSVHHIRNIAQSQDPQIHFSKKNYNSSPSDVIHVGSAPLDKNSRVAQPWEESNKAFPSPLDQISTTYPFQCQSPLEQRQNAGINTRMPWQQIRLTAAIPNQNRIELSRQLSNQQMAFLITSADWKEDSKSQKSNTQKSSNEFPINRPSDAFSKLRQDSVKQGCRTKSPCQFTNKVESSQNQVGGAKNKSLYFAVNHAVHGSTPRTPSYPPLHVPPLELMMVSPYDSPSQSPIQNHMASSTCSSLSPDSTSPASGSSDETQKAAPSQFYNPVQSKAALDNQHHYNSEVSRCLRYNQEKAKENIMSFSSNIRHTKPNAESGESCIDSYEMEHRPPPPYSAHQLLATSLATANLDQLDVLLTCKQCEQNFNNLASFLDHKQYCGQHAFAQNDFKGVQKVEDTKKFHAEHTKAISSGTNFAMSQSSSDLHMSLLGLNKNGEIMPDSEAKVDAKDDPMKLMLPSAPLPDLEMEDAKLDSLITEALNGLGYQSDNAEIDSSFIDAFADDEITTTKCSSSRQTLKTKDSVMFESRSKHEFASSEKSLTQQKYTFDADFDCLTAECKHADATYKENNRDSEAHKEGTREETSLVNKGAVIEESNTHTQWVKDSQKSDKPADESEPGPKFLLSRKFSGRGGLETLQNSTPSIKTPTPQSPSANRSPTPQRSIVKERKRKRISGGSWSKELIHKIVQQKNKLHKLHVKGTKNMQFSLVMERVTPTVQNPTFREYDYISDSDEDCEPVKIASQGRLSQSIRCKYTYTKECKGRIRADKNRESPWKQDRIESFELKKAETASPPSIKEISGHQRVRRRSSRSSTSSELSTSVSVSSESISSPKSIDRTDSDCEKRVEIRKKDQDSFDQDRSPQRILKESSTSLALTFTKNTKHYSTDKILLSELNDSYTTSKCSNVISTTEETASEHTLTKSTVSLARFKTTRVEVEGKMDHYDSEMEIAANTEEATPLSKDYKDYKQASMHLRRTGITVNSAKTKNDKDIKRDHASLKSKTLNKKKELHQNSESSPASFENYSTDISAIKETRTDTSNLFSEPPSLCSSLMDEVCLSSAKLNDALPQKDRSCLMPYTLEHEQSLMKSPLSFDTTSMFADLTVGGFENNLYPDIQLTKESFSPIETTGDKKELFESSFSPLLEQRDWSLMVDVTPELPDEIAQYKEDSDIANDKKTCFNPVPFTLTEKIIDYHSNLNGCVSDDELEIKRIVTELESQLQSAKLSSPSPLDTEPPKHFETMSKFSPLRLDDHESESDQNSMEVVCPSENLGLSVPTDNHSELFSEPDLPWSSPVQFGLMGGQQYLHTPTHPTVTDTPIHLVSEILHIKGSIELNTLSTEKSSELNNEEKPGSNDSLGTATKKSEEMIEQEIYTENLMKSLEVISDSLSSGLESTQSSVHRKEYSEEQEKEDDEKTEKAGSTNESERVDARYCVADPSEGSSDLNKTLLEHPPKLTSDDICESNLASNTENSNAAENNDVSLHDRDTQVNELQPASTCGSINISEESNFPSIMFDHKTCESAVETGKVSPKPEVMEGFNSEGSKNNPNTLPIIPDVLKDDSRMAPKQESSQAEEVSIEKNATKDYKDILQSASVNQSTQQDKTEIDTMGRARDNGPVLESSKSPHHEDAQTHDILISDTDMVSTHEHLQIDKNNQSCEATLTFSDAHNSCEENVHIVDEDLKLKSVPPISPSSVVPPYSSTKSSPLHGEKSLLSGCWTNIDTISPALIEETLTFKSSADVNIASSLHTCESSNSASEIANSFASSLKFAETTESKISSPRKMLAVDNISKQTFKEANGKSEILDVTQNKNSLYEFKLSPMNYSQPDFTSHSLSSETLNKSIDVQSNIKSSPKDTVTLDACALTLNTQLSSNCRLSPIHVQNELELTTYDHLVKLDIPHFHDSTNQRDMKYCCISPTNNQHVINEHKASDDTEQLSKLHQNNISTCHVPLDSIDYMDLNINLLRKTDVNVGSPITTFKLDVLPQNPILSSVQETRKPKEQLPTGSISLSNSVQSEVKSLPKKGGTQNAAQGKFQCEICLMYFRTLPGLKRHKAMKHAVKTEGIIAQKPPVNSQGFLPHPVDKDLKDNLRNIDPVVLLNSGSDVTYCELATLNSSFEGKAKESLVSKNTMTNDKEDTPPIIDRTKKNNKVKRSKSMDGTNEGFIHKLVKKELFPDELLTILKTDILQAISPDFPTMVQPECPMSSGKLSQANSPNYHVVKDTEDIQVIENACGDEQEITALPKCPEMYRNGAKGDNTPTVPEGYASLNTLENNTEANGPVSGTYIGIEEICDPCEDPTVAIKNETNSYPTDGNGSHCKGYKDPPVSPSKLGTDLKDLFDDENTFSQLFPRNDEMKRKKCARVYGKSNKRQKQMPSLVSDYTVSNRLSDNNEHKKKEPDSIFATSLDDHCENETVSLDDAKMLEICHKSIHKGSPQKDVPQNVITDHVGHEDTQDATISDFLCHTEDAVLKPTEHMNGSEDKNVDTGSDSKENCKPDVPCPLKLVCVQDNVPPFPSIDIQNFNTTFQLPEMPLFESERDISVVEAIVPKKSPKKPTERKNRKQIETGLKPKDKEYKCKVCFTWFLTLGELDFHKLSHNPSPPPTCYMCVQRKFSSREQLREHLKEKHVKNKAGVWTCGMCLKEISDVWMYNEHLREHATQFARKGQSQSSLLDMPGCFMQENAVKNFISSIMQHQSKKSIKGENAKSSKEERKASTDVSGVVQKFSDMCEPETIKSKVESAGGGSKRSIVTPLEVLPKADTTPKNIEMHPNCKDPSRDCHHCGKQFPKPFKLQRHLVVHNLQKIFMCHKCPVSYQQAKELKDHFKSEHEEVEEPDSKHTILYTCELCADVMHVIKKSFICSTCNYTFSKKEQFDRHMEKHLAGGSKIFKFRGVVRPCTPSESKEEDTDMPPNKKRKVLTENSKKSSLNIVDIASVHLEQNTDIHGLKAVMDNSTCTSTDDEKQPTDAHNTSVKIEDMAEDLTGALEELGQQKPQMTSAENNLNTKTMTKEEDNEDLHAHDAPDTDVSPENKSFETEICEVKVEDDCGTIQTTTPTPKESSVFENKMKECTNSVNAVEKEADSDPCISQFTSQSNKSMKSHQTEDTLPKEDYSPNGIRKSSLSSEVNQLKQDLISECASTGRNENEQVINIIDKPICVLVKERTSVNSEENIKQCLDNSTKFGSIGVTDAAGVNHLKISLGSITVENKDCVKLKKRKDLKTVPSSPRTTSSVARENLGIDLKVKKKFRSNKCERLAGQRKGDISVDYPVLTSVKDEMTSNKIAPKHKMGALDLQPKRGSDNFSPKKGELVRHLNWDCRGKKGVPTRAIHSATSKVSVTSLNNSFNKSRPKLGVKSVETQSFHTAESHNSLLSKLFGQRLTGFKIPLRKDTSESIT